MPRSANHVLKRAERRLISAITRGEPQDKLAVLAERVRNAQLGWIKASDLAVELPTDVDDEPIQRRRENLATTKAAWERMAVDEIVALYRATAQPVASL